MYHLEINFTKTNRTSGRDFLLRTQFTHSIPSKTTKNKLAVMKIYTRSDVELTSVLPTTVASRTSRESYTFFQSINCIWSTDTAEAYVESIR